MIITTIEELRLSAPAHAIDSFDSIRGVIENVEHDVLEEKLGTPLYQRLCQWYDDTLPSPHDTDGDGFYRLWRIALHIVAYASLDRGAGQSVVSFNNAGINQFQATDYPAAPEKMVDIYRQTNRQEALSAVNRLLRQLEVWCQEEIPDENPTTVQQEVEEIVLLWKSSRYYYLSTTLLIPTAVILQQYLDFSENRDRFIRMLPDLHFIQEEQIAPAIGEDFLAWLIQCSNSPLLFDRIIHRLRKAMASLLAERTSVIKYTKEQRIQYHDDSVRRLQSATDYIRRHQTDILEALGPDYADIFESSPLYVRPVPVAPEPDKKDGGCHHPPLSQKENPALWTAPLL